MNELSAEISEDRSFREHIHTSLVDIELLFGGLCGQQRAHTALVPIDQIPLEQMLHAVLLGVRRMDVRDQQSATGSRTRGEIIQQARADLVREIVKQTRTVHCVEFPQSRVR